MSLNSALEWTKQPLRFFQHLLRETDAADTSVDQLIREIKSVRANACIVMGGGFSAWYPTGLSSQTVNPHLRNDFLGNFLQAARQEHIRSLVRMDISKGRNGMQELQPDWFVRKADGEISSVWEMPQICATGPFWQEQVFQILDEILDRYPNLDGFFFNYLHVPRCHCERCQRIVAEKTGRPVPEADRRDPVFEAWRQDFLAEYVGRIRRYIQERNPGAAIVPYHHVHDGWNIRRMAKVTDIIGSQVSNPVIPNPIDPQPIWNLWAAEEALTARALKQQCPPLLIQTTSEVFASRQSAMPDARLIHNLVQAAAHGASTAPAVNGPLDQSDARFVPALQEFGDYLQRNAHWYRELGSIARVAILRSEESRLWGKDEGRMGGTPEGTGHVAEFRGICECLGDLRYPYDIVVSPGLEIEDLARYDLIILPCTSCLSAGDATVLDAYVQSGGRILVTADFGGADGEGAPRDTPALASLPALPGKARSAVGAYLELGKKALSGAVDNIPHIPVSGQFWTPFGNGDKEDDLRIIGPFANNAPEFTTVEGPGKEPGLIERRFGEGYAVWLPWRLGALYHRSSVPEFRLIFGAMVKSWIGSPPVRSTAPTAVETIVYRHPEGIVLHLLNGASAQTKGLTELTPLAGFEIAVECDAESAFLLNDGSGLPLTREGKMAVMHVDRLDHFLAIVLTKVAK
ncbi:alpha-amylase family protein [Rhizobium sp. BK376]|uniref:alpha-amylase family protein n=1 Tax=Rhizobium sp. BK376 TaxID=2512149 RepID=UPI0010E09D66|nr:alpha-amylase family protein [Rhizobium sp. BK376]TCR80763.1 beta-galactosidase-like protein [Rhizobium sp. BK376]